MRRLVAPLLGAAAMGLGLAAAGQSPPVGRTSAPDRAFARNASPLSPPEQTTLVRQYCVPCHNDRMKTGGLTLAGFDGAAVVAHRATAEKIVRKLRTGMMPPPGAKRPGEPTLEALATAFEVALDAAAAERPNPGWRPFQRLNRAEYGRVVRDLLDVEIEAAAFLPPDTVSGGFDNVADAQTFSPALMDGYLRAAAHISRLAVGDANASPGSTTYKLSRLHSQVRHVEGAPIGTRGGLSIVHVFPADGEYVFKTSLHYEPLGGLYGRSTMTAMGLKEQVEVSVNGERVALLTLNTRMNESDSRNGLELVTGPVHVKAGPQRVSAAFVQNIEAPFDDLLMPLENSLADVSMSYGVTVLPHMRDLAILGPSRVTGVSETPSRRKIFSCRPSERRDEARCAGEIIARLAAAAYRGPVRADDVRDLTAFYERGRRAGDFESGIRLAIQAILASPRFLFRLEEAPGGAGVYALGDVELASRLSFFLWGTVPDAQLVRVALAGRLQDPRTVEAQVRRMLADPRAEALSRRFAAQWLRLQALDEIVPDYLLYPQYDDALARGFRRETELFFDSLVREDRSALELLTADYTFVNERVARHYGIPNIVGHEFRRVRLPETRRGILGHGSILTLTSVSNRTSPVLRGKWVMEVLLGSPPPPPPPDVPSLDDAPQAAGGRPRSVRDRMVEHRRNPACASCHRVIDPLGLALEHFDPTGAWRIKDNEVPVDPTGELYDGTRIDGADGLRDALLRYRDAVLRSFTESLLTYAVGRRLEHTDMPAVRAIVHAASEREYRMSAFILGVVNSGAFRTAVAGHPSEATMAAAAGRGESRR